MTEGTFVVTSIVMRDMPVPKTPERGKPPMHPSESPSRTRPVQRTLFAPPCELGPEKLYYSVDGAVIAERERIVLRPHTRATTNTYFGRFPASYWQRWTGMERVFVRAEVAGEGKLLLKASARTGRSRTVDSVRVWPDLLDPGGRRCLLGRGQAC